ncbi:protein kinase domain-containing protein [Sandaracinus amylolyticus]|uniref:protein kinase domain-containing protein n=1 Tax=Sandaracinus amylolyticus TaxID=927083 RepID=UPI001F28A1EA|nr:CHASE domain-containing protein [Sandaracinus amylolyticus]UJR86044.1 Hypothetical protein I5071_81250 [Sandaracinus amylolyticus]
MVLAFGVVLTIAATALSYERAQQHDREQLAERADRLADTLRDELGRPLEVLRSVPAFFAASEEVPSRDAFTVFVRDALARHQGIAALEWAPFVRDVDREAFEATAGFPITEVAPDGAMVPRARDAIYAPLRYAEPSEGIAFGYDLLSEPVRRASVEQARELGEPVGSRRLRLVEDPEGVFSLAVYLAMYERGVRPGASTERDARATGLAIALFRLRPLLDPLVAPVVREHVELALIDPDAPDDLRVLYETAPGVAGETTAFSREVEIPFAERSFRLIARPGAGFGGARTEPLVVLVVGLLLSALLAWAASGIARIRALEDEVRSARRLGRYVLERKLGEGGTGVVYLARHAMMRRPTAIKILRGADRERAARFEREVQLASRLVHPNTVQVWDYGRTPGGELYYAMEHVDGLPLDVVVREEGALPAGRVVRIVRAIAEALDEAHGLGIVHRDVKPANVMLAMRAGTPDAVKVLDFGLGKVVSGELTEGAAFSHEGTMIGTPVYMAPEQISAPARIDARADLYSVGALAYHLLTGTPPFVGETPLAVATMQLRAEVEPPSQRLGRAVPAELEALVMRLLEKDRARRLASARALIEALDALQGVVAFGDDAARAWWATRGEALRAKMSAEQASATGEGAVDVDVDRRVA